MTDCAHLPIAELVAALQARGVRFHLEDGEVRVQAKGKVSEDEKQRLRDAKPQVIALLQGDEKTPIGAFSEEAHGYVPGGNGPKPEVEPAPKAALGWSTSAPPRYEDPTLPIWLRGDSSKPKIVKRLRSGLRIEHNFD